MFGFAPLATNLPMPWWRKIWSRFGITPDGWGGFGQTVLRQCNRHQQNPPPPEILEHRIPDFPSDRVAIDLAATT